MLKRIGENGHPYLTPRSIGTELPIILFTKKFVEVSLKRSLMKRCDCDQLIQKHWRSPKRGC